MKDGRGAGHVTASLDVADPVASRPSGRRLNEDGGGGGWASRGGWSGTDHYAADRCCHTMDDTKEAQEAADRSTPPPTSDKHLKVGPPPPAHPSATYSHGG